MIKLKVIKEKELAISIENNQCDYCGESHKEVFTSSFDDTPFDTRKCVMQICHDCIRQLAKTNLTNYMLTQDKINKEDWKEKFFERFGGEGTIAKTDENCILIAFTKKEVIDFIETLLKEHRESLVENIENDLENGKFYSICSNESSFKNYIINLINQQVD